ncbi:MAG: 3-oxoacyl-ACP reductase FabG [Hyphomicrobiaceae bacterium]|nr:3-oxoacyl-ACP reductase FabG [Hyphomicrobiaceae bacterium]
MLLDGKIAIVTGAGQGIGRACAERLAREGAKVLIADVNDELGAKVADAVNAAGGEAVFHSCDVSERLDVHNLVAAALERYERIDVLVNNAGVLDDKPFLDLDETEFDRVIRTNLKGAFLCGQAVARQLVKQLAAGDGSASPGAIVNMSSVNAWFGLPDHVAYSVSKGGIAQLTKSMAIALAPHGIRVNAVGPGTIETPLIRDVIKDQAFRTKVLSRTPLGRFGKPEEIAAIVAWLASDQASYVTGTTVYADGGRMPLNYVVTTAG